MGPTNLNYMNKTNDLLDGAGMHPSQENGHPNDIIATG